MLIESAPVDPSVVDLNLLREWMDQHGLGEGAITDAVPLAGGTQNLLLQFVRSEESFLLRRPPLHKRSNSDETMRREARILAALDGSDVPHPRLIAAESDESVLGASFYLMEVVDGFIAGGGMPTLHAGDPEIRRKMGFSFADAAASLGAVDHVGVGLGDFGKADGYLQRQVPRWRSQLDSFSRLVGYQGPDIPHLNAVGDWLERNCPKTFTPGLIHGDFHLGNVMFRPDAPDVAAVVDWELATVGDPLVDVGGILAMWPDSEESSALLPVGPWDGFPTASELIERYRLGTERDMSMAGRAPKEMGDILHAVAVGLFERGWSIIAGLS